MQVVYPIREGPFRLARSTFGHCPNSNWTPHSTGHFIYIYHQDHLHSSSSNRLTALCRSRIFFSSCSLQVQWSRYLFCFGVSVSVLIFAMIQDQALVASKHYLIETNENSPGDKQEDNGWEIFVFLKDFSVLVVCPYLASPKISL